MDAKPNAAGRDNGVRSIVVVEDAQDVADSIRYNLESYFVPEGEGRKLEDVRNKGKLAVVAAVLPSGRAAIKRLLIDGKPVYEEPLF